MALFRVYHDDGSTHDVEAVSILQAGKDAEVLARQEAREWPHYLEAPHVSIDRIERLQGARKPSDKESGRAVHEGLKRARQTNQEEWDSQITPKQEDSAVTPEETLELLEQARLEDDGCPNPPCDEGREKEPLNPNTRITEPPNYSF